MKGNLIQRTIDAIKPGAKPFEVWDEKLTGFLVRVQPSGHLSYYVQYRHNKRIALGKCSLVMPGQARETAKELIGMAAKGASDDEIRRAARPVEGLTLARFIDDVYGPWVVTERKSGQATVDRLRTCFYADFGNTLLENISVWAVELWRKQRKQAGLTASTCNRDLTALKAALSKAAQWGKIERSPIASLRMDRTDRNPVTRYLSVHENTRLRMTLTARDQRSKAAQARGDEYCDHLTPLVLIALATGMRRGELFNLHWQDIDLTGQLLTVVGAGAKSAQSRHIPLHTEALAVLTNWHRQCGDVERVFTGRHGRLVKIDKAWRTVLRDAKIDGFRFHDLRHSFASSLIQKGVSPYVVQKLLGQSSLAMTERYMHLHNDQLHDAVAQLDQGQ